MPVIASKSRDSVHVLERFHQQAGTFPLIRPVIGVVRRYWLAAFVVGGLAYLFAYLSRDAGRLDRTLRLSIEGLAGTVLAQLLFWLLASLLWRRLVNRSLGNPIGLVESFAQLCVVNLGKYLPGKVWGMIARGSRLRQLHQLPIEGIVGSTIFEQYFLLYSAGIIVLLGAIPFVPHAWTWPLIWLAGLAIALVVPAGQALLGAAVWIGTRMPGGRIAEARPRSLRVAEHYFYLAGYLGIWLLLGAVLFGLAISILAVPLSLSVYLVAVVAATAGYVAGFLAVFAPAGIGVREAVGGTILATIMSAGDAILLTLVFRLWTIAAEGLAGGLILLLAWNRNIAGR